MSDRTRSGSITRADTHTRATVRRWERAEVDPKWDWVVPALIVPLAAWGLIGVRHGIEADLASRTSAALGSAGAPGLSVSYVGRDGEITGPRPAKLREAEVLAVAAGVEGVRVVTAQLQGEAGAAAGANAAGKPGDAAGVNAAAKPGDAAGANAAAKPGDAGSPAAPAPTAAGAIAPVASSPAGAAPAAAAPSAPAPTPPAVDAAPSTPKVRACQEEVRALLQRSTITFETDSAALTPAGARVVGEVARVLRGCPEARVRVEGHTDAEGDDAHNQRLSEARAATVVAGLAEAGVSRGALSEVGHGEARPVADNGTEAGMAKNRRIELVLSD